MPTAHFLPNHNQNSPMTLLSVIITLVVVGVLLWLVTSYIPMDATIKRIIQVVVIIAVVIWLLNVFGVLGKIDSVPVPKVK